MSHPKEIAKLEFIIERVVLLSPKPHWKQIVKLVLMF